MSNLILVRHGQAMAFAEISDRLSPTGELQSHRLGEYWLRQGLLFDAVYVGPLQRQRRTAELVCEVQRETGRPWPEMRVIDDLAEYDADGIIRFLLPPLAQRNPEFRGLVAARERHRGSPDQNRYFQHMFEALMKAWVRGEMESPQVESWPAFRARVERALRAITAGTGRGRLVAAFTSGGFIGAAVQLILCAPEAAALELNWRIYNGSLTGIVFSGSRLSLDSFNTIPHLDDPALRTYR